MDGFAIWDVSCAQSPARLCNFAFASDGDGELVRAGPGGTCASATHVESRALCHCPCEPPGNGPWKDCFVASKKLRDNEVIQSYIFSFIPYHLRRCGGRGRDGWCVIFKKFREKNMKMYITNACVKTHETL
jgi:hypothetical protein